MDIKVTLALTLILTLTLIGSSRGCVLRYGVRGRETYLRQPITLTLVSNLNSSQQS